MADAGFVLHTEPRFPRLNPRMASRNFAAATVFIPILGALAARSANHRAAPAALRLSVATLHAAALTSPRAASDSADNPYLLVAVAGPGGQTSTMHLPETGHLRIHHDEALGARPLTDVRFEPGDSIRVLISVLDAKSARAADEDSAARASGSVATSGSSTRLKQLFAALFPVTSRGDHWLGSAMLTVTNENGVLYWRTLDCIATCRVVTPPVARALEVGSPVAGVVELSGGGATYHLQLHARRAP